MPYAELHCHSYYSFHDGASSLEELLVRARDLGYSALALTDHDNLCGAMRFAQLTKSLGMQGITGAEVTLKGGTHLTLLAKDGTGYRNLCRLITAAHQSGERNKPELSPELLTEHAAGLIVLSGCPQGELAQLVSRNDYTAAKGLVRQYLEWFGTDNYYIELQYNRVFGDAERNQKLATIGHECGVKLVAAGNVHYHIRERHQLQDCLVAVKHCLSLEESHRERRANSEFFLRTVNEIEALFSKYPEAVENTMEIAGRCTLDLTKDLSYIFPDYAAPDGLTPDAYLEKLCREAAVRRYGAVTPQVQARLAEEFRLIRKYKLPRSHQAGQRSND
jgi:error-prone DNA polymerase